MNKWMITTAIAAAMVVGPMINAEEVDSPAPVSATSSAITLDTRTMGIGVSEDENVKLDTRSYTVDWSDAIRLNTKAIVGTMFLLK